MADRPIIFSAPMVRALLDGRKSQTRRVIKPHPAFLPGRLSWPHQDEDGKWVQTETTWRYSDSLGNYEPERETDLPLRLPYAPGDRLYVREALDLGAPTNAIGHATYTADGADVDLRPTGAAFWASGYKRRAVPSIHMPRWASRMTLTVTDVRVQRLQEISAPDSIAEGVECETCTAMGQSACRGRGCFASIDAYRGLWNSLHGPEAWAANPWIVALTFTVQNGNIDQLAVRP